MDAVHIHLLTNHIPILATVFSVFILAWGLYRPDKSYRELAMVGFVIAGLFSVVVMQSGEGAEELVEKLPGVSENYIHRHEDVAEIANWISVVLALISFAGLLIRNYKPGVVKKLLGVLLLAGVIASGFFVYAAYLGGQIRHIEIRPESEKLHAEEQYQGSIEREE